MKLVLLDPFVLRSGRLKDGDVWKQWRGEVDKLCETVAQLAADYKAIHVQTQKVYDAAAVTLIQLTGSGMASTLCLRGTN